MVGFEEGFGVLIDDDVKLIKYIEDVVSLDNIFDVLYVFILGEKGVLWDWDWFWNLFILEVRFMFSSKN